MATLNIDDIASEGQPAPSASSAGGQAFQQSLQTGPPTADQAPSPQSPPIPQPQPFPTPAPMAPSPMNPTSYPTPMQTDFGPTINDANLPVRANALYQSYQQGRDQSNQLLNANESDVSNYLQIDGRHDISAYRKLAQDDQKAHGFVQKLAETGMWQQYPQLFEQAVQDSAVARGNLSRFVSDAAVKGQQSAMKAQNLTEDALHATRDAMYEAMDRAAKQGGTTTDRNQLELHLNPSPENDQERALLEDYQKKNDARFASKNATPMELARKNRDALIAAEKLRQFYDYQATSKSAESNIVDDPVAASILQNLAKDQARHTGALETAAASFQKAYNAPVGSFVHGISQLTGINPNIVAGAAGPAALADKTSSNAEFFDQYVSDQALAQQQASQQFNPVANEVGKVIGDNVNPVALAGLAASGPAGDVANEATVGVLNRVLPGAEGRIAQYGAQAGTERALADKAAQFTGKVVGNAVAGNAYGLPQTLMGAGAEGRTPSGGELLNSVIANTVAPNLGHGMSAAVSKVATPLMRDMEPVTQHLLRFSGAGVNTGISMVATNAAVAAMEGRPYTSADALHDMISGFAMHVAMGGPEAVDHVFGKRGETFEDFSRRNQQAAAKTGTDGADPNAPGSFPPEPPEMPPGNTGTAAPRERAPDIIDPSGKGRDAKSVWKDYQAWTSNATDAELAQAQTWLQHPDTPDVMGRAVARRIVEEEMGRRAVEKARTPQQTTPPPDAAVAPEAGTPPTQEPVNGNEEKGQAQAQVLNNQQPQSDRGAATDTTATPPVSPKEPWQMTREEYARIGGESDAHREAVEGAIARGDKVPSEVLNDYPWLAADEAIKPYVDGLKNISDKQLKAEEKRAADELNKWANGTPSFLPDGTLNPQLRDRASFEIGNKFNAIGREIEARKRRKEPTNASPTPEPAAKPPATPPVPGQPQPAAPAVESGKVEGSTPVDAVKNTPHEDLANTVAKYVASGQNLTHLELTRAADRAFNGSIGKGTYQISDAYDAMQLGVNKHIAANPEKFNPTVDLAKAQETATHLNDLTNKLPTLTRRTAETNGLQQFSTPPAYAFAATWAANLQPGDHVLEPSAGVGGIAVFAKNAGADVHVNELAPRRADLLKSLGFSNVTTENAEQISNTLADTVHPNVVIMNPPFSQTAGRMGDKKMLGVAGDHILQAFKLLPEGGRLVAIVGEGMKPGAPAYRKFFEQMAPYLSANVGVSGDVYKKYGTTFGTRVLVFDKAADASRIPVTGDVPDVLELMQKLQGVRDARIASTEQSSGQSGMQGAAPESGPVERTRTDEAVPAATGGVGDQSTVAAPRGRKAAVPAGVDNRRPDATAPGAGDGEGVSVGNSPEGTGGGNKAAGSGSGGPRNPANGGGGNEPGVTFEEPAPEKKRGEEITDAVFENYKPQKVKILGAQPHPTALVESAAMASVSPPKPTYNPKIDQQIIKSGRLSDAQLENIVYAGQAHEQMLPDGRRRGYFIGDGTGVGKGAMIAGIFQDNWARGRQKGVWVSENFKLLPDAKRDWNWVGGAEGKITSQDKIKPGEAIQATDGILFTGYGTLRKGYDGPNSRVTQIVNWLGNDFDGVIAFDEAHNMKSSIEQAGARGKTQVSDTALAAVELQKQLPNARIVYVSATGATEVANLAYAERLGVWGEGTPFPDKYAFVNEIKDGGVAAMELVARDMKQMGVYMARGLSFEGVKYDRLEHPLTTDQTQAYDKLAEAWQHVLNNINEALEITAAKSNGKVDGRAKSSAYSAFWSGHQRFFNQIITAMQMPTVLKDIAKQLDAGKSVVLQLTNTNEAAMERSLAKLATDNEDLENLDLTPRDGLMQLVEHSFPVNQMESYMDGETERMRPVLDSKGNPVVNRQAVEKRERLLQELGSIRVPEGPLEMLLNHFGVDNVAENTGRSRRVVRVMEKGKEKTITQNRTKGSVLSDVSNFNAGKKRILVFSQAGGTGASYHADKRFENQQDRIHYLLQAGWVADKAVQGFGRTHRSNQVSAPFYQLVTTDLPGQKRFVSSIARRMDQLGAITKGQRQAASQGIFKEADNLESQYARDALHAFYKDLYAGKIRGITMAEFADQTGLRLLDDHGNLLQQLPPITQFLNRMLSLSVATQHDVFNHFAKALEGVIKNAKENGTYDAGVETVRADKIDKNGEQVVYTDPRSGAETKMVDLTLHHKTHPLPWDQIGSVHTHHKKPDMYVQNKRSGNIFALIKGNPRTLDNGRIVETYRKFSPNGSYEVIPMHQFVQDNWNEISTESAKPMWDAAVAKVPPTEPEPLHMITGAILPIWDRLRGQPKVFRLQTSAGERILGRVVPEDDVDVTLKALGRGDGVPKWSAEQTMEKVMGSNMNLTLSNGWKIKRSLVNGEQRLEIIGPDYRDARILERHGVFGEVKDFRTRYFIPTDDAGALGKVLEYHPIAEVGKSSGGGGVSFSMMDSEGDANERQIEGSGIDPQRNPGQRGDAGDSGQALTPDELAQIQDHARKSLIAKIPEYTDVQFSSPSEQRHKGAAELLKNLTGGTLHIFRGTIKPGYEDTATAYTTRNTPGHVFLNESVPDALIEGKVFHEGIHQLSYKNDHLYQRMLLALGAEAPRLAEELVDRIPFYADESAEKQIEEVVAFSMELMTRGKALGFMDNSTVERLRPLYDEYSNRRYGPEDGGFDGAGTALDFSKENAPTFYSRAERVVGEKMPEKAAPLQVQGMLLNAGVKPEEMKWSGLDTFLQQHRGAVTKQEVLDYLRQNNLQVQEVMKGGEETFTVGTKTGIRKGVFNTQEEADAFIKNSGRDDLSVTQEPRLQDQTKFRQYQLPGGENYRELLLTMPPKTPPSFEEWANNKFAGRAVDIKLSEMHPEMVKDMRREYDAAMAENKPLAGAGAFHSSHWDEPNVLAHVRFNTRHDAQGNKVLHIEEVQSDWHQKGRGDSGYKPTAEEIKSAESKLKNLLDSTVSKPKTTEDARAIVEAHHNLETLRESAKSGVPDAPFKKTWHELALRRMLRYAAEHGYDKLSWTPGEQQAERYNLSKHVRSIEWSPITSIKAPGLSGTHVIVDTPSGLARFNVDKDGIVESAPNPGILQGQDIIGKHVADILGKEVAEKIMGAYKGKLEGEGLKIGGKGMEGFYDKIIPDYLNKYGKRWGAKVGETKLPIMADKFSSMTADQREAMEIPESRPTLQPKTIAVPSIDITPAMRKSILEEGQPLFSKHSPLDELVGLTRGIRERFSHIEARTSPAVARYFIESIQSHAKAETIVKDFLRRAFKGAPEHGITGATPQEEFIQLGYSLRGDELEQRTGSRGNLPSLGNALTARLLAEPYMKKAVDSYNKEISPIITDIRQRNGLLMNSNAKHMPFFINLPAENEGVVRGRNSAVNSDRPFNKAASGEGSYESNPQLMLSNALGSHLRYDAAQKLNAAIKKDASVPMPNVIPVLEGTRKVFVDKYGYRKDRIVAMPLDLHLPPGQKDDVENVYVPEIVADEYKNILRDEKERGNAITMARDAVMKSVLITDVGPHSARIIGHVAGRIAQSGQSWVSTLPSWLGSNEMALARMDDMYLQKPLGATMQILLDSSGGSGHSLFDLKRGQNALSKAIGVGHVVLTDPNFGVDPRARRVIANAYLHAILGNDAMARVEADLKSGAVTPAVAAKAIEKKLTDKQVLGLARWVNGTLGFANRQTRSQLLNRLQQIFPFLGTQSGMIPHELVKTATLNLNPKALVTGVQKHQYAQASKALAGMLASGALGLMVLMNIANWMTTKADTGEGHFMQDNDPGHKADLYLSRGWHWSNVDPGFSRASRLMGMRDFMNTGEHPTAISEAREGVNEALSSLDPMLRSLITMSSGKGTYLTKDWSLMNVPRASGLPIPTGRNTVEDAVKGNPVTPGIIEDVGQAAGLTLKPPVEGGRGSRGSRNSRGRGGRAR